MELCLKKCLKSCSLGAMGTPLQRGSAFVWGLAGLPWRQESLPEEAWPQVQVRKEEIKMDAATVTWQREGGGVWSLTGPCLKKVPRLNLNIWQRPDPAHPQETIHLLNYGHLCRNLQNTLRETDIASLKHSHQTDNKHLHQKKHSDFFSFS